MNTTVAEGRLLTEQIVFLLSDYNGEAEVIIAPPFTHLESVANTLANKENRVALAAQNCSNRQSGAFTGEVSASMLKGLCCQYVIIGHSERREYYGETNETLLEKINVAVKEGLKPIYCVGEKLEERETEIHFEVVANQIKEVLYKLQSEDLARVIVAYEPVWAIGTGKTATADQAEEMHKFIRKVIADKYPSIAAELPVLYGGSCKPSNAKEIFSKANVDGGLIGGASLVAEDFVSIIKSF